MISCRGNTCIPYMKLHNTSWADPKWRFSTGKESWILQHDPGLSDSSHWTGKAGATLWCWGKLSTSPDPSLRQESNSLPHEASLLQASSPGKAPSSQRGQGSSREGEQEPRRRGGQFLPSWAVGHLFSSVHVQWKDREARGRRDDTRQSSSEWLTFAGSRHRKDEPILSKTPCCEWQLDAPYQEWAAAATAETTHLQNVRAGDFSEELQGE